MILLGAVLMALDHATTLVDRFLSARSVLDSVVPRRRRVGRTYQGFIKAVIVSAPVLLPRVRTHLRSCLQMIAGRHWTRFGWVLFAVDGSKIDCVRSRANERAFGVGNKKNSRPQQFLTTLWHIGTGLPWAWMTGRSNASERGHLRQMIGLMPRGSMVVCDAGFTGFDLLWQLQRAGLSFLIRVGANVTLLQELGFVRREGNDTVYLWPHHGRRGKPLVLRVILVPMPGKRKPIFLISNVQDRARLSHDTATYIYQMRWGIEVFFRSFKQTLERRKMRSAAPTQAALELQWNMIGLLLLGLLSVSGIIKRGIDPIQWAVAAALRVVRQAVRSPFASIRTLTTRLARSLKDTYTRRGSKKARDWPHKKTCTPPGQPNVRIANKLELRRAQRLTHTEVGG